MCLPLQCPIPADTKNFLTPADDTVLRSGMFRIQTRCLINWVLKNAAQTRISDFTEAHRALWQRTAASAGDRNPESQIYVPLLQVARELWCTRDTYAVLKTVRMIQSA